jgi:hypothetical protein
MWSLNPECDYKGTVKEKDLSLTLDLMISETIVLSHAHYEVKCGMKID